MDLAAKRELLEGMVPAAMEAGHAIMRIYAESDTMNVQTKSDQSPVTDADLISSDILVERLSDLLPEAIVVSEEGPGEHFHERNKFRQVFLVDPLDGTKEFVKHNDEFCINIALVEDGRAELGLIYAPAKGLVYYGIRGGGAWRMQGGAEAERISSTSFSWTSSGLRFITSRSHMNGNTVSFIEQFSRPVLIHRGSAIKFLWIARGDADVYPKRGRTMEWDTAAGQVILEEAGGAVIDFATRQPLRYNKADLANPHFLAFGKAVDA